MEYIYMCMYVCIYDVYVYKGATNVVYIPKLGYCIFKRSF